MKNFLKKFTVSVLLLGILLQVTAPLSVLAQAPEQLGVEQNDSVGGEPEGQIQNLNTGSLQPVADANREAAAAQATARPSANSQLVNADNGICNGLTNFLSTPCWGWMAFFVGSKFVYIAGIFLNFAIDVSVVNMKALVDRTGAINTAWKTFRDLANVFFIFILIYIAISTIVGAAGGNTWRMLRNVVLVALFINFSLFFTKVIIDASNIVAVQFYNSITKGSNSWDNGLSHVFMENSKLKTIFNVANDTRGTAFRKDTNFLMIGLMSFLFGLILAFVFIAIGMLFVIRLVALFLVMIFSPLAFLGHTVPKLEPVWKKYWETLINQAIFAPLLIAILWVTASITNSDSFFNTLAASANLNGANLDLAAAIIGEGQQGGSGSAIMVVVNFAILITLLIGGLVISKQFSFYGGGAVIDTFSKLSKKTAFFLPAAGARLGVGMATEAAGKWYAGTGIARTFSKVPVLKSVDRAIAGGFAAGQKAKFGLDESYKEREAGLKARAGDISQATREKERDKDLEEITKVLKENLPANDPRKVAAKEKLEGHVIRMSDKEIEDFATKNKGLVMEAGSFVESLTTRHIEALKKSEKLSEADKEKIMKARQAPLEAALKSLETAASGSNEYKAAEQLVKGISERELELLSAELIKRPSLIGTVSSGQIESLLKSNNLTRSQKDTIKAERVRPVELALAIPGVAPVRTGERVISVDDAVSKVKSMKARDLADLDEKILTHGAVIEGYNPGMLAKMSREMSSERVRKIREAIENHISTVRSSGNAPAQNLNDLETWLSSPLGRQAFG